MNELYALMTDREKSFIDGIMGEEIPALYTADAGPRIPTAAEVRAGWLLKRRGKLTASEAHRLMANGKVAWELSAGAKTYCMEKAVELLTEFDPDEAGYISPAMQWGMDREHDAVDAFIEATGINLKNHGREQVFIELGNDCGGTPDAIYPGGGVEIKCPNSITHMGYFEIADGATLKAVKPEYYWQCTMLMLVTGASQWHFISYDPRLKNPDHWLHMALIQANYEDITMLITRLDMAIKYRDDIVRRMA